MREFEIPAIHVQIQVVKQPSKSFHYEDFPAHKGVHRFIWIVIAIPRWRGLFVEVMFR